MFFVLFKQYNLLEKKPKCEYVTADLLLFTEYLILRLILFTCPSINAELFFAGQRKQGEKKIWKFLGI